MRGRVSIIAVMLGLSACQWGETSHQKADINTDTLAFTYQTIKKRADDCGDKADTNCTVVRLKYPHFKTDSKLNDSLKSRLLNLFFKEKPDTGITEMVNSFLTDYYKFKKDDPRMGMIFDLDAHAIILRQDSSLTTLEIGGYTFQGGAHGSSVITFINWNTKKQNFVTLSDILTDGYKTKLAAVADTIFRRQEKLSDTTSLARDYFFKDDKFSLNENYLITPLGIRFLYNQYEIKPYAAGTTDLFIPYNKIRSLLRPNTVVTQYIK